MTKALTAGGRGAQAVGKVGGRGSGADLAIAAIALTAGIMAYDNMRGGPRPHQENVQTGLSIAIGAIILISLAEFVPEVGVPLTVLLLVAVAIGRPKGINLIAKLTGTTLPQNAPSGPAVVHRTPPPTTPGTHPGQN